jgi:signal transduction histidine kinase
MARHVSSFRHHPQLVTCQAPGYSESRRNRYSTVTITTNRHDGFVSIETADTGRGIPPERLDSIFDIGFAPKDSRIRLHVGLANVKATIDRHNGEIRVESELGKGTTFAIRLPVQQRA